MSGFAGVLTDAAKDPDDRQAILAPMAAALTCCGPDGARAADDGRAAMTFHSLHMRGSRRCTQPVVSRDGLFLAWDGRLDNRSELLSHLDVPATADDVEIVLAAYRRWREGFASRMIGDFALALRDAPRHRLHLVRDPMAGRPLFFATRRGVCVWASTVRALSASGLVPLEVDDRWVAAYLMRAQAANRTPFMAVQTVAPGERVTFKTDKIERHRFWEPSAETTLELRRDEDYEEAFRELFLASVRHRLRGSGPVVAELSGGLDSSSIVCAAHHLMAAGEVEASELYSQSWVYDRAAAADERPFIDVVERHTGRPAVHVLEDDDPVLTGFEKATPFLPHPWQNWPLGRRRSAEMLRQVGGRLLFSGHGGDHLLWSELQVPTHLADLVMLGRPRQLWKQLGAWRPHVSAPLPLLVWNSVLKPLWRSARGRSVHELTFGLEWLTQETRQRMVSFFDESFERRERFQLPSRLLRIESLKWAINGRSTLIDDVELGFETCYPFLDRPLAEFCLAIPFEQLARPEEKRSLHRRALRGILPEIVRVRECKRGPSDATMQAFRREWPVIRELFEDPGARLYQRGHVDRECFLAELRRIRHGVYGDHAIVVRALQVEVWLRFVESCSVPPSGLDVAA